MNESKFENNVFVPLRGIIYKTLSLEALINAGFKHHFARMICFCIKGALYFVPKYRKTFNICGARVIFKLC